MGALNLTKIAFILLAFSKCSLAHVDVKKCQSKYPGRKYSCSPEWVLQYASTVGWNDSTTHVSAVQTHNIKTSCVYEGNCNMRGENLIGRCFCLPGWTGKTCEKKLQTSSQCTNTDDRCFYSNDAGVWIVSTARWKLALEAESSTWNAATSAVGDRVEEHMKDFKGYEAVGPKGTNLGRFIEVGAGPWTQSLHMIRARNFKVEKYVILEPNAINYASMMKSSPYRHGSIREVEDGQVVIINAGAEHLDLMGLTFDTLMLVNVLEHVQNAVQILRNVYNALKPGGLLIFSERWWDFYTPSEALELDSLYHPIRLKKAVVTAFLRGFDTLYEVRDRDSYSYSLDNRNYNGTYFIGRKKASLCN